jgi:LmbE family N-acetylglucosaminyl deacetylase
MTHRISHSHPHELGTILAVWAHPDDETYLAAGVLAAARDLGQRVVCVSLTAGEHGTDDPVTWPPERLASVRRWEAAAALAVLGVTEHHVFGFPDGGLRAGNVDALELVGDFIEAIDPDTILTFGADGMTFHPDHIAVHDLVTTAWMHGGCAARLMYAATTAGFLQRYRSRLERWGMYMTDERPTGLPESRLGVHLRLSGAELDRKVTALRAMSTQTGPVVDALGEDVYRDFVSEEAFVDAERPRTLAELATAWYARS